MYCGSCHFSSQNEEPFVLVVITKHQVVETVSQSYYRNEGFPWSTQFHCPVGSSLEECHLAITWRICCLSHNKSRLFVILENARSVGAKHTSEWGVVPHRRQGDSCFQSEFMFVSILCNACDLHNMFQWMRWMKPTADGLHPRRSHSSVIAVDKIWFHSGRILKLIDVYWK